MAAVGYRVGGTIVPGFTQLGHGHQHFIGYIPIADIIVASGCDNTANDHYLFQMPATPATPGDTVAWPIVQEAAAGDAWLDGRSSAAPMLYVEGTSTLHVFVLHGSSRRYKRGSFAANGQISWNIGGSADGEGVAFSAGIDNIDCIVDGQGRPWWVFTPSNSGTSVLVKVRDAGAWQADVTAVTYAAHASNRACAALYTHTDGSPGICIAYITGLSTIAVAYRLDSQPLTDPWTQLFELDFGPLEIDNHLDIQTIVLPGQTRSTFFGAFKIEGGAVPSNNLYAFRVDGNAIVADTNSPVVLDQYNRPKVSIDSVNNVGRASGNWGSTSTAGPASYWEFDLTADLPATAPASVIIVDDDTGLAGSNSHDCPSHLLDADSGWVYRVARGGSTPSEIWWNEFPIAAAGPQPPQQNVLTPDPLNIAQGATGTIYDASGDWSEGSGGTLPLTFTATTLAAGFTITTTGQIQSDGSPAPGTYSGQQYQVDDAALNGPTLSNVFSIVVAAPSTDGILTTPPLRDDQDIAVTGRTGMRALVYPVATAALAPVYASASISQEADGTVRIEDPSITPAEHYKLELDEPTASGDPGQHWRGTFSLIATGGT